MELLCEKFIVILIFLYFGSIMSYKSNGVKKQFFSHDGYPLQYISGSIHYFRVHPADWRDRLKKLRWAGFQAVQTIIEWSSHEPEPGVYEFSGGLDIERFIQTAEEEGLKVILRPGPYICAERDMGGLPYWLLRTSPYSRFRTSDDEFMKYVTKWFNVLLPRLKPYMYHNGGPVVMVQVENEYGNCQYCDFEYLTEIANLMKNRLGQDTFLFSTDNGRTKALRCGKIPNVYATVDFGPDANASQEFESQNLINGGGPLINSEYHLGWFDHWGVAHRTKDPELVSQYFDDLLGMGASVNFYMFLGGTSFGFGSNQDEAFRSCPTSYDFDAVLTEGGDMTPKYYGVRKVIGKYFPLPSGPPPINKKKFSYGKCLLTPAVSLFEVLPSLSYETSIYPKLFENLKAPNGIVVYETILNISVTSPAVLKLEDVHDRAYIFVDYEYSGIMSREKKMFEIPLSVLPGQKITVIVESQGRISVGKYLKDFKGLINYPLLNACYLKTWKNIPVPLYNIESLQWLTKLNNHISSHKNNNGESASTSTNGRMVFFRGKFSVPYNESHPRDTFLKLDAFMKGYVWINNFLLGRYWPIMGPQLTLYVPHGVLKRGQNSVLVFELEGIISGMKPIISFQNYPEINGSVPFTNRKIKIN